MIDRSMLHEIRVSYPSKYSRDITKLVCIENCYICCPFYRFHIIIFLSQLLETNRFFPFIGTKSLMVFTCPCNIILICRELKSQIWIIPLSPPPAIASKSGTGHIERIVVLTSTSTEGYSSLFVLGNTTFFLNCLFNPVITNIFFPYMLQHPINVRT